LPNWVTRQSNPFHPHIHPSGDSENPQQSVLYAHSAIVVFSSLNRSRALEVDESRGFMKAVVGAQTKQILGFIWPGLKITGKAYRVPVRTGSIAELNLLTERPVTVDEVNDAFRKAAETAPLKGILGVLEEEWTSSRILGDPHSSIVDLPLTAVQAGTLLSVAAWYDNEMGFSTTLAKTAARIAG
jgi:glyceraldehyde-3-phosphate dehydrogenase/erythrose-4-phosphate dehydrogenase